MSCGSVFCGLTEIKPKQTSFCPCLNLPPLHFIIPLLSTAPVSSQFCSRFQRKSQSTGHPEQNSSPKLPGCNIVSCCKQQVFRQEGTSLVFMGVLDQPLTLGSLSWTLSAFIPMWKRADLVASTEYYTCAWRVSLGRIQRLSKERVDDPRRCGRQ